MILPLALIVVALAITPVSAKPSRPALQTVDSMITRAVAAWAKVNTLRATFEQTIVNPITGSTMKARGELQQRKPSRLAITFTDPAGDRIVADGKNVWVFLPSATPGQVIKMTNAQAGAATTDLIGQFLTTPRRKYDATDTGVDSVNGRATRALVLVARPGESLPFIRAKVWVDTRDHLIRQFESTDANGLTRRIRLLTLTPNAAVQNSAFRFTVPTGVRVVSP
jgi:outer membrane lipoprotein carrier protein